MKASLEGGQIERILLSGEVQAVLLNRAQSLRDDDAKISMRQ